MPTITWGPPVQVTTGGQLIDVNLEAIENLPGVYYFSRTHGEGPYCPFYIGRSQDLKTRLSQYLYNNSPHEEKIRNILLNTNGAAQNLNIANGPRFFHYGYLNPVQGLQRDRTIARAERALIHYALILGWELVNKHHVKGAASRSFEMAGDRTDEFLPEKLIALR